jgi:hypothetical protein
MYNTVLARCRLAVFCPYPVTPARCRPPGPPSSSLPRTTATLDVYQAPCQSDFCSSLHAHPCLVLSRLVRMHTSQPLQHAPMPVLLPIAAKAGVGGVAFYRTCCRCSFLLLVRCGWSRSIARTAFRGALSATALRSAGPCPHQTQQQPSLGVERIRHRSNSA